ncbi:type IV pilus modification protein PilV [Hydrogenophaga sp.]|uniref:type IV pilus modification protein PilV n=1 Tax=Hydrogenophaga sp. TaxID=1904254 RepID=UPI00261DA163|nr:type IV pilus modification protein PilV [Hydrogenophaga sp.]MCW5654105.1 type IV pilus modification protein PilV [Hydrogenophaga sp.]
MSRPPLSRRQRGVGLIEILVAVLILALGLLGMAGLQANALKTNQSSYARGQAVMLSYYMLDAMRADRSAAVSLAYNTGTVSAGVITPICSPLAITGSTLADNNRKDWIESLKISLGADEATCGAINCDVDGVCTIQITWDDSRAGGLGAQRFETQSRL